MVRFSAPDECDSHPAQMDWESIADNLNESLYDDDCSDSLQHMNIHDGGSRGLVAYVQQHKRQDIYDQVDTDHGLDNCQEHSIDSETVRDEGEYSQNFHFIAQELHRCLHQSQVDYHLRLQEQSRGRRRKLILRVITSILFISMVFIRHAPPPPPLVDSSTFHSILPMKLGAHKTFWQNFQSSFKVDLMSIEAENIIQYESWANYSQHVLVLACNVISYIVSVAWYALSNSLCYTAEEIKDVFLTNIMHWIPTKTNQAVSQIYSSQIQPFNFMYEEQQSNQSDSKFIEQNAFGMKLCPIRIPAATNRRINLPLGASGMKDAQRSSSFSIMQGLSTEEFLKQHSGLSLPPQNLAVNAIVDGIDLWGQSLVEEAPVMLIHRMSNILSNGFHMEDDKLSSSDWIIPPAMGMLFVGPEGVGKLRSARSLAHWLFSHCIESGVSDGVVFQNIWSHSEVLPCSSSRENNNLCYPETVESFKYSINKDIYSKIADDLAHRLDGVLEIIAEEHVHTLTVKEMIVNHIRKREGIGSVVLIHHIELLPISLLASVAEVLSGRSHMISYESTNGDVMASCNGTVFLFTSKQWGTKSIFEGIQRNGGLSGLRREFLIPSIQRDINSNLGYWVKVSKHFTIVPYLPFQKEDLASILRSRIEIISDKLKAKHWKRLNVSSTALEHFLGANHVEYFDLFRENDERAILTFSLSGAMTLDSNTLLRTLNTKVVRDSKRRPYKVAFVDMNLFNESFQLILSWCDDWKYGVENCESEWKFSLNNGFLD